MNIFLSFDIHTIPGKNLWRDTPGEITESTIKCRKNKRRIVKMFAVIIAVFGICWLPYHVYFIYSYHHPEIMRFPHIKNIYLGFYWLAMANCAVNPIVSSFHVISFGRNPKTEFSDLLLDG